MFHRPKFGSQGLHTADPEAIEKFIGNATHQASSRFLKNLHRWEKYYPPEQIFIGFQEQIRDTPEQLLKDVCLFLGLMHLMSIFVRWLSSASIPINIPTFPLTLLTR